ncbi:MAG: IS1634 family transposase [Verrucomicrobiota bacterium]|nr:IS1634 family transposase [Verrucomicrobiota bacterium]MDE3068922.1 IS1634 family transposase [Verrucomicrobiota bacterium]
MFVQTTQSARRNGKTYVSYLVRESFRTDQGPRSRTVCNITDLPAETRQIIAASLKGQRLLPAADLQLEEALDYGGLAVLNDAWSRFGLAELFAGIGSPRQRGLLQATIYSRLLFPCAQFSLAQKAQGTWLAQACGLKADESFNEDDIYRAMDQLNGHWVGLEKQLYQRAFPQAVRLVLYDLTGVYFEGKGPEPLAQYGHSRDHRADRPQIILAVATDTEGLPLHVSILRGNRHDTRTLQGLLKTLRRRFGIREATFVFDGGMSSRLNLEAMTQAKLGYVTRLSAAALQTLVGELALEKQLELGDRPRLLEITHQGKRYVIAGGPWRQQRDQDRRRSRLVKAEAELKRLAAIPRKKVDPQKLASQVGRTLQRLKAHKYFTYQVQATGQLQWQRKEELIAREAQQDGWYLLHTNEPAERCTGQQVLAHYKGLLEVEEAFCELKSCLEVRPVFHHRPDRVVNHVRLCFLAYWLSARLGSQWRAKGQSQEVPRLLRHLQTIRLGVLKLGQTVRHTLMTHIPMNLNDQLLKLGLAPLFAAPPRP